MRRRVDERRRAPRLRIDLRVYFHDGGEGVSRDISAVGIFLETDRLLLPSGQLRLALVLGEWDTEGLRIHGDGRVVRAAQAGGRPGFALEVAWFGIEPLHSP